MTMNRIALRLRIAFRSLRRAPAFTIAVVLSLALGIGANGTMFAIMDAALLRRLPYARPDELVAPALGSSGIVPDSYFLAWASTTRSLTSVAEYNALEMVVSGASAPEALPGAIASPSLVQVLGVTPALGRFIGADDAVAGAEPVAVLGEGAWRRLFNGDPHILGRAITVNDVKTTVVGVMPSGFAFPARAEIWLPRPPIDTRPGAGFRVGLVVGRMRAGASHEQVQRELNQVPRPADLLRSWSLRDSAVAVVSLHDALYGSARPTITVLFAAVTLLLLVACANVANLMLVRTSRRRQEFAVRAALGASRSALYWEVVTEGLVLALGGGAVGVLLSVWLSKVFTALMPARMSTVGTIGVDAPVLLFTAGVSVLAAFLISSWPALKVAGAGAHVLVGAGGSRIGDGRSAHVMRRTLVVVQLSASIVLLTGAGLLAKSLALLEQHDNGFQPEHLLIVNVRLASAKYRGPGGATRAYQLYDELAARFAALPGAVRVAEGLAPLTGYDFRYLHNATPDSPTYSIGVSAVGAGYFETYGVPVLAGRSIAASDDSSQVPVVVVNASAARVIAPDGKAIGRTLDVIKIRGQNPTIVGIVADVPQYDVAVRSIPQAFSASQQDPRWPYAIGIRVSGSPDDLAASVQRAVREIDPMLVVRTASMESMLTNSLAPHRFTAILLGTFAGLAIALAAVGLFGVVSYVVELRRREFGVRIALGAQQRQVLGLVLREGLTLTALGLATGIALALALAHLLKSLLYGVQPTDLAVVVASALALGVVALLAAYIPARGAARTDPMIALRME
jgi:putative ABC transport system permease protein